MPAAELKAFDASGLLAITVPPEHGGPGLPATVLAEVIRSIAMVDPAIAQVPQGHFLMVDVLAVCGNAYQQERLLGSALSGGRFGNALAERGGHHAQDLKTRVSRADGEVLLNGRSTTPPARSRPAGSASARSTTKGISCWRSSSVVRQVSPSTTTGT